MVKNILILNLTRMGDLVQSTPLIAGLRRRYPDSRLTLLVSSDFEEFSHRVPGVDDTLILDLRQFDKLNKTVPFLWVDIYYYLKDFLDQVRKDDYDLVVNLSHSKFSAFILLYLGIKSLCGFACNSTGDRKTDHAWMQYFGIEPFNRMVNPFNLAEIFARSGDVDPAGRPVRVLTKTEDDESISDSLKEEGIGPEDLVIGIQAGSSLEGRRWSAQSFADLANLLINKLNARIILFGVTSEADLANEIHSKVQCPGRVMNLAGKTGIGELIAWLKRCDYLVTNDTGPMHVAAAVGTRIVGLFFAHAHPWETGPYSPGHLIFQARIDCAPCSYGVHCNNIVCIEKVLPHHVYAMLSRHRDENLWSLPDEFETVREVNIFQTRLDEDNRVRLEPLLKHPLSLVDIYRESYSVLWRDSLQPEPFTEKEFSGSTIVSELKNGHDCSNIMSLIAPLEEGVSILNDLIRCSERGKRVASAITAQLLRRGKPNPLLQQLACEIETIDERIALLGSAHQELKPLADMFAKRKENFQGDDPLQLAQESIGCYNRLKMECEGMKHILADVTEGIRDSNSSLQIEHNSINVAVPGR